ncbi:MAG TPA: tRNA-guanine(15) transglycosylase, partial [Candidatus Methanomethylia archaeon]|nr:tRNA-guanine(15) transglycosylase [Candidatus Methanomethylicia archaeon]
MPVEPLERLRAVLRYQYGEAAERLLRKERLEVVLSKRTGKMREVRAAGKPFISIRAKDGYATLSMEAAKELLTALKGRYLVTASRGAASFIAQGRNLFAKHVVSADANIR